MMTRRCKKSGAATILGLVLILLGVPVAAVGARQVFRVDGPAVGHICLSDLSLSLGNEEPVLRRTSTLRTLGERTVIRDPCMVFGVDLAARESRLMSASTGAGGAVDMYSSDDLNRSSVVEAARRLEEIGYFQRRSSSLLQERTGRSDFLAMERRGSLVYLFGIDGAMSPFTLVVIRAVAWSPGE